MKKEVFLFSLLVFFLFPMRIMAAGNNEELVYVNPVYEDEEIQLSSGQVSAGAAVESNTENIPTYSNLSDAATFLKEKMLKRVTSVEFQVSASSSDWTKVFTSLLDRACVATDETAPEAGDYLRWHFYKYESVISLKNMQQKQESGGYLYHFKGKLTYMTSGSQERELNKKIKSVMKTLKISKMTNEYDIVNAVYGYVTSHVKYDSKRLYNNSYLLKYSAYDALVNNRAICQGYANLIYRMLREAGLSVRFIGGKSRGQDHAWNIVRINGKYYNLDSTWDAGSTDWQYFLRGSKASQFPDHTRNEKYKTEAFQKKYPMSTTTYKETTSPEISYKITYVLNGGTNHKKNPESYFLQTVQLKNPYRTGYEFLGWYRESNFQTQIKTIEKTAARNYKVYAKWKKIKVAQAKITDYKIQEKGMRIYFEKVSQADGYKITYSTSSSFQEGSVTEKEVDADKLSALIKSQQSARRYYVYVQAYRLDSTGAKIYGKASEVLKKKF